MEFWEFKNYEFWSIKIPMSTRIDTWIQGQSHVRACRGHDISKSRNLVKKILMKYINFSEL